VFPEIDYLDWIAGRPAESTHDFATSEIGDSHDGVVPAPLTGLSAPADRSLESLVAAAYPESVSAANVLVTAGASQANVVAVATALADQRGATAQGGSRVLVESPAYEPLLASPAGLDATVDRFRRPPAENYRLDPAAVEAALREETRLLTVTNRHNPSGRLAERATLADLARTATDAGAFLLVDEVYAPYRSEPFSGPGQAFGGPTAAGLEGTIVTSSVTKFFGLGELRIGWVVADRAVVERATSIMHHVPDVAVPSRELAKRLFANRDDLAATSRRRLEQNHTLLAEFVARRPDLRGVVPDGSSFAFLAHETADGDAVATAGQESGVLVVPGRFFEEPAHFRISLGRAPEEMAAGLDAFGSVLDDL
jgi:aspartate/methionine/tyrosine aminotransferase